MSVARWLHPGLLLAAGVGDLVVTGSFLAQVPTWLPARTAIDYVSGMVELACDDVTGGRR